MSNIRRDAPRIGEVREIKSPNGIVLAPATLMAAAKGWAMVRRPYAIPFVVRLADWQVAPLIKTGKGFAVE